MITTNTRLTRRAGLRRRLTKSGLTLRGKNGTFSEKVIKKGPKTGSVCIVLQKVKSKFFRHFQGFLKIQVEMTRAGKGGEAGANCTRKNH